MSSRLPIQRQPVAVISRTLMKRTTESSLMPKRLLSALMFYADAFALTLNVIMRSKYLPRLSLAPPLSPESVRRGSTLMR